MHYNGKQWAVNNRVSYWGSCGMWPMSASTKGHGPVLEESLGTSTAKHAGLGRAQPQSWFISNYGSLHYPRHVWPSASLQGSEKCVLFGNKRSFHRPVLKPISSQSQQQTHLLLNRGRQRLALFQHWAQNTTCKSMPFAHSSVPISRSICSSHAHRNCRDSELSLFHIHYLDSLHLHLTGES